MQTENIRVDLKQVESNYNKAMEIVKKINFDDDVFENFDVPKIEILSSNRKFNIDIWCISNYDSNIYKFEAFDYPYISIYIDYNSKYKKEILKYFNKIFNTSFEEVAF